MNSYLSLVPISARVHKRQSGMTRICIVLAVFLVTSIFSMVEMWIRAEQAAMIHKHGNYHIILQDVQADIAAQIRQRPDIAAFSEYGDINADADQDYHINGKNVILNIFPSLDTSVCATSVRKFNKMAAGLKDTVVLAISKDLPFAHGRFCTTEGIENVIPLSDFRFSDFDESYGVRMADGPLAGLLARAVVVIGKDGKIAYTELVPEITQEPDYDKALAAVK